MLPDFIALKRDLIRRMVGVAQAIARGEPIVRAIPSLQVHEGDCVAVVRVDGSVEEMTFDSALQAEVAISAAEARADAAEASIRAVRALGEKFAEGMSVRLIETIEAAVEETGNKVDAKGRRFTPEMYIEALQTMDLSFKDDGEWDPPTILAGPELSVSIAEGLREIDASEEYRLRVEQIVENKREEWRAREARRTLAD